MYCIETNNLSYGFPGQGAVLTDINIRVPKGAIYGFLGANGAGKTTTLRLLLGLLKKQGGSISLLSKSFESNRIDLLNRTGSLIESPSLYAHLNARDNLKVWNKLYRCPAARIEEVLCLVGLADTGNKKAGKFSLGMKQRLGIAVALLPNPELLILDEPTNGLDPNGIIEIRALLQKLNRERNMTIVISSHLLAEIEKLVSHLGIIHKGSVLFQGTLKELQLRQSLASGTFLETSNPERALKVALGQGLMATIADGRLRLPVMEKEGIGALNEQLVAHKVGVYQIGTEQNDLESIFINLIK